MLNSNLNLSTLPESTFTYQFVNSALLFPCMEYQRLLRTEKVASIAENFSEYIANDPKVSFRDGRYYVFDGQNTVEARRACNGGKDLPIRCKVFLGLSKEDEATLFALQTGNATCLTAGERLRANLVAENPDALYFVGITSNAGVEFAYDGIRAAWKIYCIETAYELYKQYGRERYIEMLHIINEAWKGNVDSYLAGVIRGVARFISVYEGEYSRERLVQQLARTHPKTITQLAQKDTGSSANRHMRQILRIYNGASREMSLPLKTDSFVLPPEQQPSWYSSAAAVSYIKRRLIFMLPNNWRYLRGDIYYADMEPHIGSEQGGKRPVVVLQNNIGNRHSPTLIVATVTTRTEKKKNQPTHVLVDSNPAFEEPSMILLEQIFTIDKSRIERFMGYASKAEMLRIDMALLVSLALNVLSGNRSE